jgi:hypothetical protein
LARSINDAQVLTALGGRALVQCLLLRPAAILRQKIPLVL